jgi:hypothetical protein
MRDYSSIYEPPEGRRLPQSGFQFQEGLSPLISSRPMGLRRSASRLDLARLPQGFHCPRCGEGESFGVIHDDRRKR